MKKIFLAIIAAIGIVLTVSAACITHKLERNYDNRGHNQVVLYNACADYYVAIVEYYEPESGKWQKVERLLGPRSSYQIHIGTSTNYRVSERLPR